VDLHAKTRRLSVADRCCTLLCLKKPTGHPALRHSGNICIHSVDDQIQLLYALFLFDNIRVNSK
jgi:hypothetical protein